MSSPSALVMRPGPPAGQGAPEPAAAIGAEIKMLRKAKRLTLSDLAEATGLSAGYLSRIERDGANPSLKALQAIAKALGVAVGWFFHADAAFDDDEHRYIVRGNARRRIALGAGPVEELLCPRLDGKLQLLYSRFAPGTGGADGPLTHDGEEAGIVFEGTLEVTIGETTHLLEAGDSFHFPSELAHRYHNPGPGEAVLVIALTPPLL